MKNNYLNSFNYLRAIAIVMIVSGHSINLSGFKIDIIPEKVFANLILGGSHIFLFISGFLFHHIYFKDFSYQNFIKKKIRFVLFPYLFLSIIPILYYVVTSTGPHLNNYNSNIHNIWSSYLYPIIWYLYTGKINFAYWYVLFIMVVFVLQPLFIKFIMLRPSKQIAILMLFYTLSIFIHRPNYNINLIQSVFYFTPVYLFGIFASIHREKIYLFLQDKIIFLLLIVMLLSYLQAVYYPNYGSLHKKPFDIALPDIMMIQKLFFILLLMSFLHKYEGKSLRIIDLLASSSFGLFFIHPHVITLLYKIKNIFNSNNPGIIEVIWFVVISSVVILITFVFAKIVKIVLGEKSRMVIGW